MNTIDIGCTQCNLPKYCYSNNRCSYLPCDCLTCVCDNNVVIIFKCWDDGESFITPGSTSDCTLISLNNGSTGGTSATT